jgi:hypothetical protein
MQGKTLGKDESELNSCSHLRCVCVAAILDMCVLLLCRRKISNFCYHFVVFLHYSALIMLLWDGKEIVHPICIMMRYSST